MNSPIPAPARAFIAGATGYTGGALVRECRRRGLTTVAHARDESAGLPALRATCLQLGAQLDTTPWQLDALTRRLGAIAPTLVFAALGTTRARGRSEPGASYESIDFGLTMLLLAAARACTPPPRFVYLSAMGAEGPALGAYLSVRRRVESALRDCGLPHTIARPGLISGPDRRELRVAERTVARTSDAVLALAERCGFVRLRARLRSIDAGELARAMVEAALHPHADREILDNERLHRLADNVGRA